MSLDVTLFSVRKDSELYKYIKGNRNNIDWDIVYDMANSKGWYDYTNLTNETCFARNYIIFDYFKNSGSPDKIQAITNATELEALLDLIIKSYESYETAINLGVLYNDTENKDRYRWDLVRTEDIIRDLLEKIDYEDFVYCDFSY